ncbi:unnamed protein product [Cylindrotheca closterium]|uniref:Uncharacterized protein n=1 Tax=Cylindrotheca closterium TaxID=2856 RepID=A0AAD2JHY3_9STRA|nr:unnamed protein product [Cylindrotheca closterium]
MRPLSPQTCVKLFVTGATVGPLVDSLHNQCLLKYDVLPISIVLPPMAMPMAMPIIENGYYDYWFTSSWTVPPLLGVAYVVLGGILPRLFEALLWKSGMVMMMGPQQQQEEVTTILQQEELPWESQPQQQQQQDEEPLKRRAILAVGTTALIIKLSEYLETTNNSIVDNGGGGGGGPLFNLLVLLSAALGQWAILDGSLSALLAASVTSIGGPLSELPFVGHGVWVYLDSARDYYPLAGLVPGSSWWSDNSSNGLLTWLLGVSDYTNLGLSSITGPCYFAVTMDAIALGRWFDAMQEKKEEEEGPASEAQ